MGWLSVNSEVGAAGQCVQLLSPVLRFSETGSPPQLSVGNFRVRSALAVALQNRSCPPRGDGKCL